MTSHDDDDMITTCKLIYLSVFHDTSSSRFSQRWLRSRTSFWIAVLSSSGSSESLSNLSPYTRVSLTSRWWDSISSLKSYYYIEKIIKSSQAVFLLTQWNPDFSNLFRENEIGFNYLEGRKIGDKNVFQTGAGENGISFLYVISMQRFLYTVGFFLMYSTQTHLENADTFLLPKRWLSIILAEWGENRV